LYKLINNHKDHNNNLGLENKILILEEQLEKRNNLGRELSKKNDELYMFSTIKERETGETMNRLKSKVKEDENIITLLKNELDILKKDYLLAKEEILQKKNKINEL
jgi:hypothetical protein